MPRCFFCDAALTWCSDYNSEEIFLDDPEREGGVVSIYECPVCKVEYQVYMPINKDGV